ncbi:uncharacterized protein LOC127807704 isoform X2 [Diospyros lotus]|uniref:uncharacterized protein LOC127807704 isoform X2 n=1 Tax=Diospyros lotus TaxID=55363 RepID=UPI002251819F|nr:uncharacterized protein LOC127807704 isoform X2 [Diospyros lotus]
MAGRLRGRALYLLSQVSNHGDLAVKLSSLKQAKDIMVAACPSLAPELFPCLAELQHSPEPLVRKSLIQVVEEMRHSLIFVRVLLALLKDKDSAVAKQSIFSGTNFFCSIVEELSLQFHQHGIVERWLEELWTWMIKFKDAVYGILWEAASATTKLLALKFLETCVLLFTPDCNESEKQTPKAITRSGRAFRVSCLYDGHPVLNLVALASEANKSLAILLDLLRSVDSLTGLLTISIINCLATIARKRPLHYNSILSALLNFEPNLETAKCHMASVLYSLRTAFLGFLRCTYPAVLESRGRLLGALQGMNAGDVADQVIRQVDKMKKKSDRASRDAQLIRVDFVMEILSKLVNKQIWMMPKLWAGFLKCVSQTQPHSFRVLLQLPPLQLESVLHKHESLRGPLAAYASQRLIRTSLPR